MMLRIVIGFWLNTALAAEFIVPLVGAIVLLFGFLLKDVIDHMALFPATLAGVAPQSLIGILVFSFVLHSVHLRLSEPWRLILCNQVLGVAG
jgi:hypothetical protein